MVGMLGRLLAVGAGLLGLTAAATAQDQVASFYKGRTVTLVIGSAPGGGYDLYGRMIARYISRHIPGNPTVIAQNMPGAASNVAAAYIYNVAPKDGSVIGAIFMGAVVDQLFGEGKRNTHDTSKFNYIGNANSDAYVCLVRTDAGINSFADLLQKEVVLGASAEGASTRDFPVLLKNLLGAKFKIVAGYPGTREINLAMEKGEVQAGCGQTWSSVAATYPSWFKNNLVKPIVQESNVPQERVEALRKAFDETMKDPAFLAAAQKANMDLNPVSGERLQKIVSELFQTPPAAIARLKEILAPLESGR